MNRLILLALTILLGPGAHTALRAAEQPAALPDAATMKEAFSEQPDQGGRTRGLNRGVTVTKKAEIAVQLQFIYNSIELAVPEQKRWVEQTAAAVFLDSSFARFTFIIEGHTDSRGSSLYNLELSKRRAEAIKAILVTNGVPAERLRAIGRGEDFPVAYGDTEEDYQKNRRVVFIRQ